MNAISCPAHPFCLISFHSVCVEYQQKKNSESSNCARVYGDSIVLSILQHEQCLTGNISLIFDLNSFLKVAAQMPNIRARALESMAEQNIFAFDFNISDLTCPISCPPSLPFPCPS